MKKILLGAIGTLVVLIVIGVAVGGHNSSNVGDTTTAITTPPIISADSPSASAPPVSSKSSDDAWGDVTLLDCSTKTDQFMTTATANVRITNLWGSNIRFCV
jgi:hypothetical protein